MLCAFAEGLILDKTGQYHQGLLQKQAEVIQRMAQRKEQELRSKVDHATKMIEPNQLIGAATDLPPGLRLAESLPGKV